MQNQIAAEAALAHAEVESCLWGVGLQTGEAKYVLFEGFPPRADGIF